MNQGITIRMGAAQQTISVKSSTGNVVLDLAKRTRQELYEVRRELIEGLKLTGYFGKKHQRKARFASRRKAQ